MNVTSIIQGYYQSILSRTGSDAEVAGWANLVDSGALPLAQVQAAFINCFEALSTVEPIVEMYQAALGRVPDQAGLNLLGVRAEQRQHDLGTDRTCLRWLG